MTDLTSERIAEIAKLRGQHYRRDECRVRNVAITDLLREREALLSLLAHAVHRTHKGGGCTPCEKIDAAIAAAGRGGA